jgi:hypothetical protein
VEVAEEVGLLDLEEVLEVHVLAGRVDEGPDVDAHHLGRVDDLSEGPHHGAVDAHQLLRGHLVGLVQHDADLVVLALERLDGGLELVADVELVRVEEEEDEVCALREPLGHLDEVVGAPELLLLAGEDAGRVHEVDLVEDGGRAHGGLELVQELRAELGEGGEGHRRVDGERVSGHDAVVGAGHDGVEAVRGGLGADAGAGEVAADEVPDEGGLADGVLACGMGARRGRRERGG